MFISGRMLIYKTFICFRSFSSIHLGEERGGGGVTNACICMETHSLSYRTYWWLLTKLGRDEVIMALHMRLGFSARSAQRWIRGRRKNRSVRGPFSKRLLLQIGMQQQQTECILVSWIEISWLVCCSDWFYKYGSPAFWFNHFLRNLTFNRSAHCTQVSDQVHLGALV